MIAAQPFTGVGLGNFDIGFREFAGHNSDPGLRWDKAHNSLLESIAEQGILIGMLPAILLCMVLFVLVKEAGHREKPFLPLASAGAVFAVSLHSLVDFSLQIHGILCIIIILIAASLSQIKMVKT
jgi:O-antigen ligase